jgi:hypothetical protein
LNARVDTLNTVRSQHTTELVRVLSECERLRADDSRQHRDYQLRIADKALRRMQHNSLGASFGAWRLNVHARVRRRAVLARAMARLGHSAMFGAFGGWSRQVQWRTQCRTKIRRMVSHWHMLRVSACFEAWCEHVDSTHRRARPAVCRTTVAITRDPFGSSASRVVAEYSAGRIIEVLETRRIGRRTRGLTSAGWVWYTLENVSFSLMS